MSIQLGGGGGIPQPNFGHGGGGPRPVDPHAAMALIGAALIAHAQQQQMGQQGPGQQHQLLGPPAPMGAPGHQFLGPPVGLGQQPPQHGLVDGGFVRQPPPQFPPRPPMPGAFGRPPMPFSR